MLHSAINGVLAKVRKNPVLTKSEEAQVVCYHCIEGQVQGRHHTQTMPYNKRGDKQGNGKESNKGMIS